MRTISGLFDAREDAEAAIDALEEAGIGYADISLAPGGAGKNGEETGGSDGTASGAAPGGAGGLLAGLGVFEIPGIGAAGGTGEPATTIVGDLADGAGGGLVGSLTSAGVEEDDAHLFAEGIRCGSTLVATRVDEKEVDAVADILEQTGSVDLTERRSELQDRGVAGVSSGRRPGEI